MNMPAHPQAPDKPERSAARVTTREAPFMGITAPGFHPGYSLCRISLRFC